MYCRIHNLVQICSNIIKIILDGKIKSETQLGEIKTNAHSFKISMGNHSLKKISQIDDLRGHLEPQFLEPGRFVNKCTINTMSDYSANTTIDDHVYFVKNFEKLKCVMGHLIVFCICSMNCENIYCDMLLSPDFQKIVLSLNKLKHLSKFYYKNYTNNQRIKMRKRGVLLSHIHKIEFENGDGVLLFDKNSLSLNDRLIEWKMDQYCRKTDWTQYFTQIDSKFLSLSLNDVFKHFESVKVDTINQCNTIDWLKPFTSDFIFVVASLTSNTQY